MLELELGVGGCGEAKDTNEVGADWESSFSSSFISFPYRELGGGGFFLVEGYSDDTTLRSSSGSDISWDVRGVSAGTSCIGSNRDCRDIDDVSVLLPPPSPGPWCM